MIDRVLMGTFVSVLLLTVIILATPPASAQDAGDQQLITGKLDKNEYLFYTIPDLEEGDELYVLMRTVSGNLDPFVGIANDSLDRLSLGESYRNAVAEAILVGRDPLFVIPQVADEYFLAWDDDSGEGYSAALSYTVPEDGDFLLFIGGFPFTETFGGFELLIGIGTPAILEGTIVPTGEDFAFLDQIAYLFSQESRPVQVYNGTLAPGEEVTLILREIAAYDTLYVRLEVTSGDLVPFMVLYDYGEKPLKSGNTVDGAQVLEHTFEALSPNFRLTIDALSSGLKLTSGDFRLILGLNSPEVLDGVVEERGQPLIREPIVVKVGVEMDQITEVDQKGEKFSIVANLWMEWTDPDLAFSPDTCQCNFRSYRSIEDFIEENGGGWPEFTIFNQQERRWTQNTAIVLYPTGHVIYLERFWTILQAPDFDFRDFPFDDQSMFVRIDCLFPIDYYVYEAWEEKSAVGTQLGEEEWVVQSYSLNTSEVELLDNPASSFVFRFEVTRHLNFYMVRIIVPLIVITAITWLTFALRKYELRGTIATGNMLLFIAFSFTIGSDIPKLGYLTVLDKLLLSTFLITGIVAVYNFYLLRLSDIEREELAKKIDRIMIWVFPLAYIGMYFLISFF